MGTKKSLGRKLSPREKDVLESILKGVVEPKAIARRLKMSRKTVGVHKYHLRMKTGATSDVGLYKWGQKNLEAVKPRVGEHKSMKCSGGGIGRRPEASESRCESASIPAGRTK